MSTTIEANRAGKYLTFTLGHETYGIHVLKVREIIRLPDITPVPQMPAYFKGVINLRGKIIPAVDLRLKFGMTANTLSDQACLIVVEIQSSPSEKTPMALLVDGVEEVIFIAEEEIQDSLDLGGVVVGEYLLGMAKSKGKIKTLLDVDKIFPLELFKRSLI